jgi:hypothetical protein
MSTPDPTSASAGANVLGWPDMPPPPTRRPRSQRMSCGPLTGQESFFYPPGQDRSRSIWSPSTASTGWSCDARPQAPTTMRAITPSRRACALVRSATYWPWATRTSKPHKTQAPPPRPAGAWLAGAAAVGGPCRRRRPAPWQRGSASLPVAGAHNLDRLRIEGAPLLAQVPGWWRTRRATVAEEQRWPAIYHPRPWDGWYPPVCRPTQAGRRAAALPA